MCPGRSSTTRQVVAQVASTPQGAQFLSKVMRDAHARMIGQQTGPVRITGTQMVQLVRNEVVADIPSITLPVPHVDSLDTIRRILRWTIPFTALFAVGFFVIGFMLHPHRSALVHSLGYGMLLLALLTVVLGYVVPRFALPGTERQHVGRCTSRASPTIRCHYWSEWRSC